LAAKQTCSGEIIHELELALSGAPGAAQPPPLSSPMVEALRSKTFFEQRRDMLMPAWAAFLRERSRYA